MQLSDRRSRVGIDRYQSLMFTCRAAFRSRELGTNGKAPGPGVRRGRGDVDERDATYPPFHTCHPIVIFLRL
jgi:hypothetical protein